MRSKNLTFWKKKVKNTPGFELVTSRLKDHCANHYTKATYWFTLSFHNYEHLKKGHLPILLPFLAKKIIKNYSTYFNTDLNLNFGRKWYLK